MVVLFSDHLYLKTGSFNVMFVVKSRDAPLVPGEHESMENNPYSMALNLHVHVIPITFIP